MNVDAILDIHDFKFVFTPIVLVAVQKDVSSSRMAKIFVILLTAALFEVSVNAAKYSYDRSNSTYGPDGWAKTFPVSCNGSRQSPIDIKPSNASYDNSLGSLTFTNWDSLPEGSVTKVGNNGISYRVFFKPNAFLVSGGGLPGTFYTLNFHFHWGADDNKGSEHTMDGEKFPLELHFVNVNTKYSSTTEALTKPDGIAALGILYEVGKENQELKPFLKYIGNVTQPRDITDVTGITQALKTLLPKDTNHFYRYDGSLTTPVCQEAVTWTVFKNHKTVSQKQLDMLRGLKTANNKPLVDTYRPVQPLKSRVVKKTFPSHAEVYMASTMTTVLSVVMATVLLK